MKKYISLSKVMVVALSLIIIFTSVVAIYGLQDDSISKVCTGFMGARATCVEEYTFPFVIFGGPIALLLVAIFAINYISKTINAKDREKRQRK